MIQSQLQSHRPAQPVLGVSLLILGSFLALSLVSYSQTDPSWNFSQSSFSEVHNWGGVVGSWVADSLLQAFGLVAYALMLCILAVGAMKLRDREIPIEAKSRSSRSQAKWRLPVAASLSSLCVSALLALTGWSVYESISAGGFVGSILAEFGSMAFSTAGSSLLFVGGIWLSAVLMWEKAAQFPSFDLREVFSGLKLKLQSLFAGLKTKFKKEPKIQDDQVSRKLDELFKKNRKEVEAPLPPQATSKPQEDEDDDFPLFKLAKKKISELKEPNKDRVINEEAVKKRIAQKNSGPFDFPSLQLLDASPENQYEVSRDELIANSKALEQKLFDFGIQGQVTDIKPGPIITLYEFEPAPGVKVKNIMNLTDDLKLALKALSIRIIAPIPGKAAVGIEIPNHKRQTVYLREILESPIFQNSQSKLAMGLGKTTGGEPFIADLARMPHLLIAGATGSGKSVGLNGMIISMLYRANPEELKFIMIDPKMLELSIYDGIPHLLLPVVTDPKKSARALQWAVKEMERRYKLISSLGARNLKSYNEKVERLTKEELEKEIEIAAQVEANTSAIIEDDEEAQNEREKILEEAGLDHYVKLPNIVIVIDELADLIMVAARDVEESIARLAQMARAAGIHLILATQRPSVDVITGVIKANFPTRVAYQVASKVDSRTIIDGPGAENLIGDGDMLFLPPGTSRLERLHGPFISDDEIARIVKHLKSQASAEYHTDIDLEEQIQSEAEDTEDLDDELYDQALQIVLETQSPSASMIQRRLRVGYNRAARLIEQMEKEGVVSAPLGSGKGRELLISPSAEH